MTTNKPDVSPAGRYDTKSTCSILGLRNWDSYDKKAGPDGLTHMFDEGIILCNNTSD